MAEEVPKQGSIAMRGNITKVFGGDKPDGLHEYYRKGPYVGDTVKTSKIPVSGTIRFSDFRGAAPDTAPDGEKIFSTPGVYQFTIPDYDNTLQFNVFGAGGSSGESAYDGSVINSRNDAPGFDGPGGQGSMVLAPGGVAKARNPGTWPSSRGGFSWYPDTEIENYDFVMVHGGGGTGGGGFKQTTFRGQPAGPPGTAGVPGPGFVRSKPEGGDWVEEEGGGSGGGASAPYNGSTGIMGGPGANGGHARKTYRRTDADAPQPGQVWTIVVGAAGRIPAHYGASLDGFDGTVGVHWN